METGLHDKCTDAAFAKRSGSMVLGGVRKKAQAARYDAQVSYLQEISALAARLQPASAPILRALRGDPASIKCLNLLCGFAKANMAIDDDGLATYVCVLEAAVKAKPDMKDLSSRMAFPAVLSEELEAYRRAQRVMDDMPDSLRESGGAHPPIEDLRSQPHLPATVFQPTHPKPSTLNPKP